MFTGRRHGVVAAVVAAMVAGGMAALPFGIASAGGGGGGKAPRPSATVTVTRTVTAPPATVTATVTATATVTQTVTATPTSSDSATPTPTQTTPTATATATGTPPPAGSVFPNPDTTGVPAGWVPASTRTTTLVVSTPGAVIEDLRVDNANIIVNAPNVTLRRVNLRGGWIDNRDGDTCFNGMVIEDSLIEPPPGQDADNADHWRVSTGGYTARGLELRNVSDGFRVGGDSSGCGPVTIQDSFISVRPPVTCGDWHGDGIQGYDGPHVNVLNVTIDMDATECGGTAPFFVPSGQGNTSATVDRLLIAGPNGNYSFRLGVPGTVDHLRIEDRSWSYGPLDVKCSVMSAWEAKIVGPVVRTNSGYQEPATLRDQPCNTEGGS
jgi:hypothetical protein